MFDAPVLRHSDGGRGRGRMRVGGAAAARGAVYLESGVTRRPPQQPGEGAGVGGEGVVLVECGW